MLFSASGLRNTKPVTVLTLYVMCIREFIAHVDKFKFHSSDAPFGLWCQSHFTYRKNSSPRKTFFLPGLAVHKNSKFLLYVSPCLDIHISKFCPHSVFIILYGSQNKQRLFPHAALTDWILEPTWNVFTERYELIVYIKFKLTLRILCLTQFHN
jgi:hypothetical protein